MIIDWQKSKLDIKRTIFHVIKKQQKKLKHTILLRLNN